MDDLLDLLKQMQDAPTAENGKRVWILLFKDWDSKWMRCASICTWFNGYSESNTRIFCLPTGMPAITHSWMMRTAFIIRC